MGRLEHLHCVAISRILKHNTSKPSTSCNLATTRAIDLGLRKPPAASQDTRCLVRQLCHYNLLN
ncbi:hypothetical protein BDW62DRAFT_206894 [Aspergillus aurantiobrunneus]